MAKKKEPEIKEKKKRVAKKPRASRVSQSVKPGDKPLLRAEEYYQAMENRTRVGAPSWIPTKETAEEIERLAGMGMLLKNIASAIGISFETFCVKRREFPDLQQAIERGYKKHESRHLEALDNVAINGAPGAVQASIFKLKASHKYRDNDPVEEKDGTTRTQDNIKSAILAALRRITG